MKKILILCCLYANFPGLIFAAPALLSEREEIYQNQTTAAFVAKSKGDWLTLVGLARMAHRQNQNPLWEQGLIDWAKEIILYQYTPAGAFHLAGYYRDAGLLNQERYWYDIGLKWKVMREKKYHR